MNPKSSTTSIALILLAISIVSLTSFNSAHAQDLGMKITATADEGGNMITLTGLTMSTFTDVTITVKAPNGNVVFVDQITPDSSGNFVSEIATSGLLWKQDGFYTISAQQGGSSLYNLSVQVQIVGGMTTETSATESNLPKGISDSGTIKRGLYITADAVEGSTNIGIRGSTDKISEDVTITVNAPNGNVVSVDQVSPNLDGKFTSNITTGGPLWKQDGPYTITAQQGTSPNYRASVEVEIIDGHVIPEFGTIAALILVVAIASIIAVTARSRLGIMPKY